jgi:hypothetical protein
MRYRGEPLALRHRVRAGRNGTCLTRPTLAASIAPGENVMLFRVSLAMLSVFVALPCSASVQDDAFRVWSKCLQTNAGIFARSKETTETAADATMGACMSEAESYSRTAYRTPTVERLITGPRSLDRDFVAKHEADQAHAVADVRAMVLSKIAAFRVEHPQP